MQRLIEKDDKPLNAKEAAKEEEKIQKIIDKRKNESEEERKKREEKEKRTRGWPQVCAAKWPTPTTSNWWARKT